MADAQQQPKPIPVIRVGTREIKLSDLPAFTIGDRIRLIEQGLDTKKLETPTQEAKFVHYALSKYDPSITYDEVLDLPYVSAIKVIVEFVSKDGVKDAPFSTSSTSSPGTTAGPAQT